MAGLLIDTNDLNTTNIVVSDIDHSSSPEKSFDLYAIAHANKSHIPFYEYESKQIRLRGSLNASSIVAMDTLIDTFKGYFKGKDKNLDIEHGGSWRRYVVTPAVVDVKRPGGLAYATFDIRLACGLPFGMDTSLTTLATATITSTPVNTAITVGGNADVQFPLITATLTSGTGLTSASVSIGNNANGQVATITRSWTAGDVLYIDPYNQIVTVNDVEVYFTGSLPIFETGTGAVSWTDTFTTRSVSLDVKQYRYWL